MSETLTLSSLPLFPLGTVLFPDGVLPLRIFEVRYLDMIGKCHKAGAPFGVVTLAQGAEVRRPGGGAEVFHSVGTLATITALQTPQPGLMTIRCHGEQRFCISRSMQLKHGLWIADVGRLEDDLTVPVPDDLKATADALERLLESLKARQTAENAPPPLQGPMRLDDCGWLANRWCEILPLPLELKQRLMQLDNPLVRLELVNDILHRTGITG
ncbi:MAG: LON peptidase substrate-binding domain-containing protein [Comamonadaceae bacterium]|nr:LON peptidase substrate-binding domain-containing protein [Comamonadaceae bacterium]MBP6357650.1 LON peptidase substrate-binding domain-containing protein [Burkholderiaceae bacterium]